MYKFIRQCNNDFKKEVCHWNLQPNRILSVLFDCYTILSMFPPNIFRIVLILSLFAKLISLFDYIFGRLVCMQQDLLRITVIVLSWERAHLVTIFTTSFVRHSRNRKYLQLVDLHGLHAYYTMPIYKKNRWSPFRIHSHAYNTYMNWISLHFTLNEMN